MKFKKTLVISTLALLFFLFSAGVGFLDRGLNNYDAEEWVQCSVSPDKRIELNAYRTEPGATVDFSIKVYWNKGEDRILIYNAYHESEVDIEWLTKDEVMINHHILNLAKDETYDWKKGYSTIDTTHHWLFG